MINQQTHTAEFGSNNTITADTAALINLQKVTKAYSSAAGEFFALRGIDLQIGSSEFVAIVGKSGSGKSTLINMITGIDHPTSGAVVVNETAVHTLDEDALSKWRGRNIGIIFQFFQLMPMLTSLENVMMPMDFSKMYARRDRKKRALHLLNQAGLADQANKLPSELSGGQQQRVAIARSLATDAPILIADEPTGNLDSETAVSIFQLFESLVDQGKTIIMVTHDNDLASKASRIVTIADGKIVNDTY